VGCYIWYREEGTGRCCSLPRSLLAVPNVTVHPSMVNVPVTILLYNGSLFCRLIWPLKGWSHHYETFTTHGQWLLDDTVKFSRWHPCTGVRCRVWCAWHHSCMFWFHHFLSWLMLCRDTVQLCVIAAQCYVSTAYVVVQCLSTCLSCSSILSKRVIIYSNLFCCPLATPFWFFPY